MSFKVPWDVPYPHLSKLPQQDICRLTVEIPKIDRMDIVAVTLNSVILSTICQYAIKATAELIRTHNLKYPNDTQRLVEHICKRTYSEFVKEAPSPDERGGTKGVHEGVKTTRVKPAGARKKVTGGGGSEGTEGQAGSEG